MHLLALTKAVLYEEARSGELHLTKKRTSSFVPTSANQSCSIVVQDVAVALREGPPRQEATLLVRKRATHT